jgi:hypothetical protein
VRVSSNTYVPLSGWRDSHDFDRRFREANPGKRMEERPAKGWDIHVEAPLPTYPELAITGGLTQWFGDKVDTFGHGPLEKDPRIWDVGVKYTPIPPLSVSVTQRKAEGGRQDTVAVLSFTYPFDLSWSRLTRRTRSNNPATVEGFRYELIKRENRMPLARRERRVEDGGSAAAAAPTGLELTPSNGAPFVTGNPWSTASIKAEATLNGASVDIDGEVTWTVLSSSIDGAGTARHWWLRSAGAMNGLAWGSAIETTKTSGTSSERMNMGSGSDDDNGRGTGADYHAPTGGNTVYLTDIVGSRTVTVKAEVTIDGTPYTKEIDVSFGPGPLSRFYAPVQNKLWMEAYEECNGGNSYPDQGNHPGYPASPADWSGGIYVGGGDDFAGGSGGLPFVSELQKVFGYSFGYSDNKGAALAAGWSSDEYWTGQSIKYANEVYYVPLYGEPRGDASDPFSYPYRKRVACRR